MGDDLRNMVWKGHYLGFGPADVLMHVPVDKPLMDSQKQALIFAPNFKETVAAGNASELHSVLRGNKKYKVIPMPIPRAPRNGWAVGMAVKKSSTDLAAALQTTVNSMSKDKRLSSIFEKNGVPWGAA